MAVNAISMFAVSMEWGISIIRYIFGGNNRMQLMKYSIQRNNHKNIPGIYKYKKKHEGYFQSTLKTRKFNILPRTYRYLFNGYI